MRTPDKQSPAQRRGKPGRRIAKAGLTVAGGLLLTAGLSASPAGATVTPTPKAAHAATPAVVTAPTCDTGIHNTYEYYTNCRSTSTQYFRTVAQCADGNIALGAEYELNTKSVSVATCKNDSGLNASDNWGFIWCTNNIGTGTLAGYQNESGDISQFLVAVGNGVLQTGGNYMCDVNTNNSTVITDQPPT